MKWSLATFAVCIALGVQADNIVLKNDYFQRQLYGWNTPSYWAGKTAQIEENGKKYLQLESGTRGAEVFGRALGFSSGQREAANSTPEFLPTGSIRELPLTSPEEKNS